MKRPRQEPLLIGGMTVAPGTRKDIRLRLSEQVMATPVFIPVSVFHGREEGDRIFLTAAIHGDEINGVEVIRRVARELRPERIRGTLLLAPIANPISFMNQERELPDGRDLNRHFPGSSRGSMASSIAWAIFRKIVRESDFGIDIHTAARGRTNYPHVRADLRLPALRRLARAFGAGIVVDLPATRGMLRHAATRQGVPTIVYEAGEPLKFQRHLIERGIAGVRNVLRELGMIDGAPRRTGFCRIVKEREWIRAKRGGILMLRVRPGDIIEKGSVIGVSSNPLGSSETRILAPFSGLVLGTTTLPMVHPGSAVCHLVKLGGSVAQLRKRLRVPKDFFA